jgi:hypothetical protein
MTYGLDFAIINDIVDQVYEENKDIVLDKSHLDVYVFPQTWGSTALGLREAVGLRSVTTAYTTVVVVNRSSAYVYFNGKPAYKVNHANEKFIEDLNKHKMSDYRTKDKYEN